MALPRYDDRLEICDNGHPPVAYSARDCPVCESELGREFEPDEAETLIAHSALIKDVLEHVDLYEEIHEEEDEVREFLGLPKEVRELIAHVTEHLDLYRAVRENAEDMRAWLEDHTKQRLLRLDTLDQGTRHDLILALSAVAAVRAGIQHQELKKIVAQLSEIDA
jgi:hypothetical protein